MILGGLRGLVRARGIRFAIGFACALSAASALPAQADVATVDNVAAPIVRVNVRQGDVSIRTWDRQAVQVDGDPSLLVTRRTVRPRGDDRSVLIPGVEAQTARGLVQLPPESFVVSSIPPGPRDVVVVRSSSRDNVGAVTVRVPANSVFIYAHTMRGNLDVHDYKAGTLMGFVGRGRLALDDVGGTVFAQTNHGALVADDSNFERIRARSLMANMAFERCTVRQIEATSIAGSIVYDGGTFQPGLARFESTTGNVAIGTASAAQLGARTAAGGRVFTNFSGGTHVDARDDTANVNVGGGGPVVTATSGSGNVYLYDGSLRGRSSLPPPWHAATQTLDRPQQRAREAQPTAIPVPQPTRFRPRYRMPVPTPRAVTPRPVTPRPVTPRPITPRPMRPRPRHAFGSSRGVS